MSRRRQRTPIEVEIIAADTRVRSALAALVTATPGFAIVGAAETTPAAFTAGRILVCDLDALPPPLLAHLDQSLLPVIALGNPRTPRPGQTIEIIDKAAAADTLEAALTRAAYVIRRNPPAANVSGHSRRPDDATHVLAKEAAHDADHTTQRSTQC